MRSLKKEFAPFGAYIGVGRREIVVPVGIYSRNWGAAKHDVNRGSHMPLTVTVLAIRQTPVDPPLLLVALDHGFFTTFEGEKALRQPLLGHFHLDESRVMINLSHAHCTPKIDLADSDMPGGDLIPAYQEHVIQMMLAAAQEAVDSACPATLTWRYGKCDLATNRDLISPADGRIVVGYNADEPADDTLLVGRVSRDSDQSILATVVNYACHPTTLAWENDLASPDYVGAVRHVVEAQTNNAPCLFLQGASGDLAPAYQYVGDTTVADQHGKRLGHAVLSTLYGMDPPGTQLVFEGVVESGASLAIWKPAPATYDRTLAATMQPLSLPLKPRPSLAELDAEINVCSDRALAERLRRKRRKLQDFEGKHAYETSVWAWRLGAALLIAQPMEAYSKWQLSLRETWPTFAVAAMNVTNASLTYLVPRELYTEERYACWCSQVDASAFDMLMQSSLAAGTRLLHKEPS